MERVHRSWSWMETGGIEEDKQFDQVQQYPISFVKMWLIPFEVQSSNKQTNKLYGVLIDEWLRHIPYNTSMLV